MIKYQSKKQFPEIPDGYDPKGSTRTILPELEMVEIDGFEIRNELEEDRESYIWSEEDYLKMSSHLKNSGLCMICKKSFPRIDDVVIHIHKEHGFNGGSENIIMEAQMLLKGGYIKGNVCFVTKSDNVEKL